MLHFTERILNDYFIKLVGKTLGDFWGGSSICRCRRRRQTKQFENVTAKAGVGAFTDFSTKILPSRRDAVAPDGSDVRLLLRLKGGSMIHFEIAPNRTSKAVTHRTVEEIWYFVGGRGQVWRKQNGHSAVVDVHSGMSLTIPLGTQFQFRSFGDKPLAAIAVTMPPWPGEGEAIIVKGEWEPSQH